MQPPTQDERDLITVNEAVALTGVARSTIYRLWRRGDGPPSVTVGRARIFRRADVVKWMDERAGVTR